MMFRDSDAGVVASIVIERKKFKINRKINYTGFD